MNFDDNYSQRRQNQGEVAANRFDQDRQHPDELDDRRFANDTLELNANDHFVPYLESNGNLKTNVTKDAQKRNLPDLNVTAFGKR